MKERKALRRLRGILRWTGDLMDLFTIFLLPATFCFHFLLAATSFLKCEREYVLPSVEKRRLRTKGSAGPLVMFPLRFRDARLRRRNLNRGALSVNPTTG